MATLDVSVSQGDDDALAGTAVGATAISGANIRLNTNVAQAIFRFQNTTVPQGATIDSAYIEIERGGASASMNCTLYGEDIDESPKPTTAAGDIHNRTQTTANVLWSADLGGAAGDRFQSPDIATIIQEIVDRPGWASGNSLSIIFVCNGNDVQIRSYDNNAADAATLHIEYSEEGGATYSLDLASGDYALTGQDVGLQAGRKLSLAPGSFTLTGQDVALLVARLLVLASGSYTLTGQDVSLVYTPNTGATYTLSLDSGSYTLTGQDVGLLANRVMSVESGSYQVSGQVVNLLVGRHLSLGSGDYAITGNEVALLIGRTMQLVGGSYTLTGRPVTLVYSGAPAVITPATRIYVVPAEDRVYVVALENRTFTVPEEPRTDTLG